MEKKQQLEFELFNASKSKKNRHAELDSASPKQESNKTKIR